MHDHWSYISVVIFVTRMHRRPSSSVLQAWFSALSEETHSQGSCSWLLGTTTGKTGMTGMLGMLM
ncbi:MAG: hypothetical protein FJ333_06590 [Sphingomonadales bacterium]|nr:hypothetical protein [Sphingomonadales bacterium]